MPRPDLTVVMPVYNEEAVIEQVILSWEREMDRLGARHTLVAYDDGSRDGTPERLQKLKRTLPNLDVVVQANQGHGPTILRGYREALGEWILQIDADGEIEPAGFEAAWRERESCDFVIGYRTDRRAAWSRRVVTTMARAAVRLLFGRTVADVNCPYRLMRADRLRTLLAYVPPDTFAPNVALSGLAVASGLRVREVPVPNRSSAREGLGLGLRLSSAAARSAWQTLMIAARFRARRAGGTR